MCLGQQHTPASIAKNNMCIFSKMTFSEGFLQKNFQICLLICSGFVISQLAVLGKTITVSKWRENKWSRRTKIATKWITQDFYKMVIYDIQRLIWKKKSSYSLLRLRRCFSLPMEKEITHKNQNICFEKANERRKHLSTQLATRRFSISSNPFVKIITAKFKFLGKQL